MLPRLGAPEEVGTPTRVSAGAVSVPLKTAFENGAGFLLIFQDQER